MSHYLVILLSHVCFFSVKQNLQFILFYFIFHCICCFLLYWSLSGYCFAWTKITEMKYMQIFLTKLQFGRLINRHPPTWTSLSPLTPLNSYSKPSPMTTWLAVNYSSLSQTSKDLSVHWGFWCRFISCLGFANEFMSGESKWEREMGEKVITS